MKKSLLSIPLLAIFLAFLTGCQTTAPQAARDDFQVGIWLNRHIMLEGDQAIIAFLDDARERGVTDVYPNFWFHGYVIYPGSRLVQQHPDFVGSDPLAVVIREAGRRGMRVHAWGEYGFFTHFNRSDNMENVGYILEANPTWHTKTRDGKIAEHNQRYNVTHFSMSPGNPEARRFLQEIMLEPMRLYPQLDGINLDRKRYQGRNFGYDTYSREAFAAEAGFDPLGDLTPEQQARWDHWRVEQVNTFVRDTATAFRREFPGKVLSGAVLPPYMKEDKFQAWEEWAANSHLDVPQPMIYGHLSMVKREIDLSFALLPPGHALQPGLDVGNMPPADLLEAAEYARQRGATGIVLWDDGAFRRKPEVRFNQ